MLNAMIRETFVKIGQRNGDQLLSSATATPRVHATMFTPLNFHGSVRQITPPLLGRIVPNLIASCYTQR